MKEWELQHQYPRLPSCPQILSFTLMCTDLQRKQPDNKSSYAVLHLVAQSCLCNPMDCNPPGSSVHSPGDSPGKNTGVGCHALLQGIFPTQGLNPGLPHFGWILHRLSHQGSPWLLQWVAYPFFRGSSQPWNWTRVSCIAGRFFTSWASREALWLFRKY